MDSLDRQLLNMIQDNFPLTSTPFRTLADSLGVTETEVLARVQDLIDRGIIRRIGGNFDSRKLGYKSTLCAMKVPEERLEEVAAVVNSFTGVTHNYLREHDYNMWFTVIAENSDKLNQIIEEIIRRTGINDLLNLPAVNFYKISVSFNLNEEE